MNSVQKIIENISNFCLDLIFPKFCVGCGVEGSWICPTCREQIICIKQPSCPICQRVTTQGQFCHRCRKKSSLTGLVVAAYYQEGPLKEAIHTFKYEGVFDLARDLGKILCDRLNLIPPTKWNKVGVVVMPVPLHQSRQNRRGYNQSALLAKEICQNYHWQLAKNKLQRIKKTKHTQVELSGKARRENIKNCFSWAGKQNEYQNKIILLVDDIYTTGATLQECAKVLRRESGAKEIWGVVLAKA